MRYLECEPYRNDVETAVKHTVKFDLFKNKAVLVLGATGLIGSFITDCFLYANEQFHAGIDVYAVSRKAERLKKRFGDGGNGRLKFIEADVMSMDMDIPCDYIIHAASCGYPKAFREIPVEVFLSNVIGIYKILEMVRFNKNCRVLYVSSGEAQEDMDHLSTRACYPMGKRAAETLCFSYSQEYGVDVVMARPGHTFGANIMEEDNRATAQFITAAVRGENIKMYSAGEQHRTFSYIADCASGLMTILTSGTTGTVYGVSSGESCTVREFADRCAKLGRCRVETHIPTWTEKVEMSPIRNQIVDNELLRELGWKPAFSIEEGIGKSVEIMHRMDVNVWPEQG